MRAWRSLANAGQLGKPKNLADGDTVFERETAADSAYFLTAGHVEIYQQIDDGRSIVVRVLAAPCLFGVIEACGGAQEYLESVRALGSATIHRISSPRFQEILHSDRAASLECLASTAMAFCSVAATEMARLVETDALLAAVLLLWGELFGTAEPGSGCLIDLRRSQAEIAGVVGTSERHIRRVLTDWKARGVVGQLRGRYVVRDADFLRVVANGFEKGLLHRTNAMPVWLSSSPVGYARASA